MTWDMSTGAAPDYAPGWPSGAERLGPAWADVWACLQGAGPHWRTVAEVADRSNVARHGLALATVANMLRLARRAGLVEVKREVCGYPLVKRALYRIPRS